MQPVTLHIELDNESILDWLKNNKFIVYSEIVRYAERMLQEGLETVQVMLIANLAENIVFILNKPDIDHTLDKAMKYFLSIEEYEQCSKIQELFILIEKDKQKNEQQTATIN